LGGRGQPKNCLRSVPQEHLQEHPLLGQHGSTPVPTRRFPFESSTPPLSKARIFQKIGRPGVGHVPPTPRIPSPSLKNQLFENERVCLPKNLTGTTTGGRGYPTLVEDSFGCPERLAASSLNIQKGATSVVQSRML
jgi:hypothetical protein